MDDDDDDYGRQLKRMRNENVFEVEEIVTNIFLRLPVRAILTCKNVCKYWQGLIGSPSFIRLHLLTSQQNPTFLNYPHALRKSCQHLFCKIQGETPGENFFCDVIACFNGLICCYYRRSWYKKWYRQIFICNPATREVLLLPETYTSSSTSGVCFDPTHHGYKVFQFFRIEKHRHLVCQIYSSSSRAWKSIGTVPLWPSCFSHNHNHVCINGTAYWLCNSWGKVKDCLILAVDWEEKFREIELPTQNPGGDIGPFLIDLHGCLGVMIVIESEKTFEIWGLEACGWAKKWSDGLPSKEVCSMDYYFFTPCYVAASKNCLLVMTKTSTFKYNMRTSSWTKSDRSPERVLRSVLLSYTASLLPCNGRF